MFLGVEGRGDGFDMWLILVLVAGLGGNAVESSLSDWLTSSTSIRSGRYQLIAAKSDKPCKISGELLVAEDGQHLALYFGRGLMSQGIGKVPYSSTGHIGPGCTLSVGTTLIETGLSVLTTRKCSEDSMSVERQRLLKTSQGFRVENERKVADGNWEPGTNCSYRYQEKI